MDANRLGAGLYSPGDIVRIAKVRPQVFQAWIKAGLLIPTVRITAGKRAQNVYSYRDLLLIRLIVRLREKGFPVGKIKRALDNIVAAAGGDPGAWLESSIYADKDLIAAILPGVRPAPRSPRRKGPRRWLSRSSRSSSRSSNVTWCPNASSRLRSIRKSWLALPSSPEPGCRLRPCCLRGGAARTRGRPIRC